MFRYFARLSEKFALPVYPIAILSFDSPRTLQPNTYQIAFPEKLVLEFNFVGAVEPELQERVRQLSLTQLENLAEALLEFSNPEDLVNWLNNSAN